MSKENDIIQLLKQLLMDAGWEEEEIDEYIAARIDF